MHRRRQSRGCRFLSDAAAAKRFAESSRNSARLCSPQAGCLVCLTLRQRQACGDSYTTEAVARAWCRGMDQGRLRPETFQPVQLPLVVHQQSTGKCQGVQGDGVERLAVAGDQQHPASRHQQIVGSGRLSVGGQAVRLQHLPIEPQGDAGRLAGQLARPASKRVRQWGKGRRHVCGTWPRKGAS